MNDETVIGAMGLTGVTVFLANGYLNNYKNFVVAKTHGSTYVQDSPTQNILMWGFGLIMVTVVLSIAAESDDFGTLARGFAVLIAGTAVLTKGQPAVTNFKTLFLQGSPGASAVSEL